ncbi:hypothetical protein [Agromyces atrinae]|uniref:Uncharacterized protein n=1 Tax=Agromyces atrinae TaxID=592376 RepID=A0A4Q2M703_9MICO|nr:hypothetical protein [Agromyces atrinae]NYD68352.1 hypothetical protein [Agromyces atrinae]RXZ85602.1 hypothetical protein ESP50_13970 [Agromyces atrinae]
MKRALVIAVAAASLVLAGCSAGPSPQPPAPTDPAPAEQLFTVSGTLIDDPRTATGLDDRPAGARICWFVMQSYPPQCGSGVEVAGLHWDEVDDAEVSLAEGGVVRWAEVTLVGTFDGERISLTEQPGAPAEYTSADVVEYPAGPLEPAELARIQQEITVDVSPPMSGQGDGYVTVGVVYDEGGELQQRLDETYGVGAVYVGSFLTPVT